LGGVEAAADFRKRSSNQFRKKRKRKEKKRRGENVSKHLSGSGRKAHFIGRKPIKMALQLVKRPGGYRPIVKGRTGAEKRSGERMSKKAGNP